jgi:hypothetical protein
LSATLLLFSFRFSSFDWFRLRMCGDVMRMGEPRATMRERVSLRLNQLCNARAVVST